MKRRYFLSEDADNDLVEQFTWFSETAGWPVGMMPTGSLPRRLLHSVKEPRFFAYCTSPEILTLFSRTYNRRVRRGVKDDDYHD